MDEAKLDKLGLKPLAGELAKIDALKSKADLPALIAHFNLTGERAPFEFGIHQDNRDSTKYIVDFGQSGLGLPDRDYYLKADDAKLHAILDQYSAHVEKVLALAGDKHAAQNAKDIVALETELAKVQWTKVESRDPVKAYNKVQLPDLSTTMPGFDWKKYLTAAGLAGKMDYVIVSQPSYFGGLAKIVDATPLPVWKAYFKWHMLSALVADAVEAVRRRGVRV